MAAFVCLLYSVRHRAKGQKAAQTHRHGTGTSNTHMRNHHSISTPLCTLSSRFFICSFAVLFSHAFAGAWRLPVAVTFSAAALLIPSPPPYPYPAATDSFTQTSSLLYSRLLHIIGSLVSAPCLWRHLDQQGPAEQQADKGGACVAQDACQNTRQYQALPLLGASLQHQHHKTCQLTENPTTELSPRASLLLYVFPSSPFRLISSHLFTFPKQISTYHGRGGGGPPDVGIGRQQQLLERQP